MHWFILGFIAACVLIGTLSPRPNEVCASAFGMKADAVTWHDGMCWKKNMETPLEPKS